MEAVKSIDMCNSHASYGSSDFTKDLVSQDDPYLQFNEWFRQANDCDEIAEPNAMALATCSSLAIPSVRIVLMKWIGPDGVVFFTIQCSRKGNELEEKPNAAVVFYWLPIHRQVRIEGIVKKLSDEELTKHFHSRPRDNQFSACVSKQSSVIDSKEVLKREHKTTTGDLR